MAIRIDRRGKRTYLVEDTTVGGARKRTYTNIESVADEVPLFVDYARGWLESKGDTVAISTWEGYKTYVEKHIIPYFVNLSLKVDEVKPVDIKNYLSYAMNHGNKNTGGRLSSESLKKHKSILALIFNDAVLDGIVMYSPVLSVKVPARSEAVQQKHVATNDEAKEILGLFKGHMLYPLIVITMYYGLRRSEALGLRWSAVDFKNDTLTINHTVVKNLTITASDSTKTASSRRTYPLLPDVKEILMAVRKEQCDSKALFGAGYNDSDYVFTWPNGTLIRPDYITKAFERVLEKNGRPHMRFHDLRHSTASILYEKGWSLKDIQVWLRHSDISVTADIYTHVNKAHSDAMGIALNGIFAQKNGERQ